MADVVLNQQPRCISSLHQLIASPHRFIAPAHGIGGQSNVSHMFRRALKSLSKLFAKLAALLVVWAVAYSVVPTLRNSRGPWTKPWKVPGAAAFELKPGNYEIHATTNSRIEAVSIAGPANQSITFRFDIGGRKNRKDVIGNFHVSTAGRYYIDIAGRGSNTTTANLANPRESFTVFMLIAAFFGLAFLFFGSGFLINRARGNAMQNLGAGPSNSRTNNQ
jgi:hypothetical protein